MEIQIIIKVIFLFILAVAPSLIWLSYFLHRDPKPEPRFFLILTFILGGLATIIGILAENNWFFSFVQGNSNIFLGSLLFFIFYPFLEEFLKFIATRISVIKNKHFSDEISDPMVYMITAGLGFAAAENIKIFISIISDSNGGSLDNIINFSQSLLISLISIAFVRFIATVLIHAISSSITGYFWAIKKNTSKKIISFVFIPIGLAFSTLFHALFNYLIMSASNNKSYLIILFLFVLIGGIVAKNCFAKLFKTRKIE
jgi:RsiW-degrading membrane proteinase PrsW (M82 family)